MTGQDRIIALRRSGMKPVGVWVCDYQVDTSDGVTVSIAAQDTPEMQDWRFLVGLTVHLSGDDAQRLARITDACMKYAKRVVATLFTPAEHAGMRYHAVASIADTEGVMVWPSC